MTLGALSRTAGIAIWRQIAAAMEGRIKAMQPGEKLPTEAEFSSQFDVNRHTIRRALEDLAGRGLIRIEHGRGSFVAEDVVDYRLGARTRFSEVVQAQNREPAGRILAVRRIAASVPVADLLAIRRKAPVLLVERLGLADGRPLVLAQHHFPLPRFTALAMHLGPGASITGALQACGISDYRRSGTRITARMPSAEEAAALEQGRALPVLVTEAVDNDPDGVPINFTQGVYASARVQLTVLP